MKEPDLTDNNEKLAETIEADAPLNAGAAAAQALDVIAERYDYNDIEWLGPPEIEEGDGITPTQIMQRSGAPTLFEIAV